MVQRGSGLGFLNKAPFALCIGYFFRRQYFDSNEAVEMSITGLVDHTHAALAELFEKLVMQDGSPGHCLLSRAGFAYHTPEIHLGGSFRR
jgi:hypothetical protein